MVLKHLIHGHPQTVTHMCRFDLGLGNSNGKNKGSYDPQILELQDPTLSNCIIFFLIVKKDKMAKQKYIKKNLRL